MPGQRLHRGRSDDPGGGQEHRCLVPAARTPFQMFDEFRPALGVSLSGHDELKDDVANHWSFLAGMQVTLPRISGPYAGEAARGRTKTFVDQALQSSLRQ